MRPYLGSLGAGRLIHLERLNLALGDKLNLFSFARIILNTWPDDKWRICLGLTQAKIPTDTQAKRWENPPVESVKLIHISGLE